MSASAGPSIANAAPKYATFPPRMSAEGIIMHEDFKLPSFDLVQKDLVKFREMKKTGPQLVAVKLDGIPRPSLLPLSLSWTALVPDLFAWCIFVAPEDVVVELLEDIIYVLKIFVQGLQEGTDAQLEFLGYAWDPDDPALTKATLLNNTRIKLTSHLLHATINRPKEALLYIKATVEEDTIKHGKVGKLMWLEDPYVYLLYAEALVFSNAFTPETRTVLERVLHAAQESYVARMRDFTPAVLRAHMHLSLVLLQLGVDPEAQRSHTEWSAKLLRKNPAVLFERDLKNILARSDQPPHPVLTALGGPNWLQEPKLKKSPARNSRMCKCGKVEVPEAKLLRCAGCLSAWYCSRECQRNDWRDHKTYCQSVARDEAYIEELRKTDPWAAQRASDGRKWSNLGSAKKTNALISALGLHHDPSRGRTHIVMQVVEYTPQHKEFSHKFRVAKCGVFLLEDALPEIEKISKWDKGMAQRRLQTAFKNIEARDHVGDMIPILEFSSGPGFEPSLDILVTSTGSLRRTERDPNWRKSMNKGQPPAPYRLPNGSKDVENIF